MFSLQLTHPSPYNNHWYSSVCFTDPRTVGFIMGRYRSNIKHLAHSLRLKYHQSVWIDYINQPTPNPYAPNVLSPPHWIITSNSPYAIQEAITSILLKSQHRLIQINSTQPPPTTPPPIRLLILVGVPGSGKSQFAHQLQSNYPTWTRVSQDEQHHCANPRARCESLLRSTLQDPTGRVILDRCNPTIKDRSRWLDLVHGIIPPSQCACIFFDTGSPKTCVQRVESRTGHPTLNPESIGEDTGLISRVVNNFAQQLEEPSATEGFTWVETVTDFTQVDNDRLGLIQRLA